MLSEWCHTIHRLTVIYDRCISCSVLLYSWVQTNNFVKAVNATFKAYSINFSLITQPLVLQLCTDTAKIFWASTRKKLTLLHDGEKHRRRPACASAQTEQCLCCSLTAKCNISACFIQTFKILSSLCSWEAGLSTLSVTQKTGFLDEAQMIAVWQAFLTLTITKESIVILGCFKRKRKTGFSIDIPFYRENWFAKKTLVQQSRTQSQVHTW